MLKRLLLALSALLTAALAYVLFWPVPIHPQSWTPSPDPGLEGRFAYNEALRDVERFAPDELRGPADIVTDPKGRLVTGPVDGRIMRHEADSDRWMAIALTSARPMGLAAAQPGSVAVADAKGGLVMARKRSEATVAAEVDGQPLGYVADVVVAADGSLYFTEASSRFGPGETWADFMEHGGNGRLLQHDELQSRTQVLAEDLYFPTGLALSPDGDYLLICEATEYRIRRYWLQGPKAGSSDIFLDALPGIPFGISWNGRDTWWIAFYAPRIDALDRWADQPWLRSLVFRLPRALQPKPARHSLVLGYGLDGALKHNLQYAGSDAYAPLSSVLEHEGWLYFGSLTENGLGRIRAPGGAP